MSAEPSTSNLATTELAIETHALSKRFGHQTAVNGIDLAVPRGSVFGFLGPNGSGKTTTIRILLGLAAATSGEVNVLGREIPRHLPEVLPHVGALVEGPGFYPYLSGRANLQRLDVADRFASSTTRSARVDAALERVGLTNAAGKKVHAYSLGMKQRLGIANALLTPRELIVLDEPTNGLDPQGTREVRGLVRSLTAEGTTVFVSSHLLAEIEQMCTHVAVMSAGSLVAQGGLDELRQNRTTTVRVQTPDADQAIRTLAELGLAPSIETHDTTHGIDDTRFVIAALPFAMPPETIAASLVGAGVRLRGFTVEGENLEQLFMELTGEGFNVAQ
ncbi:MAG: ATP-binding cassette domain-containing protein [Lacisediminihabitans sp.]